MKITKIDIFNFDLTYAHGTYIMSGGREITQLPSTLVRVSSDTGPPGRRQGGLQVHQGGEAGESGGADLAWSYVLQGRGRPRRLCARVCVV